MSDRLIYGFRILDDQNRLQTEIWLDPRDHKANVCRVNPDGTVLESEEVSLEEFFDVLIHFKFHRFHHG